MQSGKQYGKMRRARPPKRSTKSFSRKTRWGPTFLSRRTYAWCILVGWTHWQEFWEMKIMDIMQWRRQELGGPTADGGDDPLAGGGGVGLGNNGVAWFDHPLMVFDSSFSWTCLIPTYCIVHTFGYRYCWVISIVRYFHTRYIDIIVVEIYM